MEEENEEEKQKTEEGEQAESTEEEAAEMETGETLEKEEEAAGERVEVEEELPPAEEEVKPPPRKEIEEEIVEERTYTIPLSKAFITPPNKRAPKAMRIIKDFVKRHMKLEARTEVEDEEEPKRLIVSNSVNEKVWKKGIEKPPRKIRVRATKDKDGNVTVHLAEGD